MNIFDPQLLLETWYIFAIFYFVFFWGMPMLGMTTNPYVKEHNCYWKGVLTISATFHVSGVIAVVLFWYVRPYLFPGVS